MKKLYTLVCLLVAAMAANAQFDSSYTVIDSSETGTVQKWLRVFEQIPADSAHTGFFIDRTPWLQHPSQYTGRKHDATNNPLPDTTFFETLTNLHFGLKRSAKHLFIYWLVLTPSFQKTLS
jgi:hypothetical protein